MRFTKLIHAWAPLNNTGSSGKVLNAAATAFNSTHLLLAWSPPGDAVGPGILNYVVEVRNGSPAALALINTSTNETRTFVPFSALSVCDALFVIRPMCATTAGRETSGISSVGLYVWRHACMSIYITTCNSTYILFIYHSAVHWYTATSIEPLSELSNDASKIIIRGMAVVSEYDGGC